MVGRPGQYQFSFNSGELAPAVQGNTGLKNYYAGAAQMLNVEPVPQGGFRLMPRSRYRDQVPRALDASGLVACRCFEFGVSKTKPYLVVMTPGLATIFRAGTKVATVNVPYAAGDIATLKAVQRLDTMLLFHAAYPVGRILNTGSDAAWAFDQPSFSNVPQVQLNGSYQNTDEIWSVFLAGISTEGASNTTFVISVDGENSSPQTTSTNTSDMAAKIKSAIEALASVDPGIAVAVSLQVGGLQIDITFSGGLNSGANFVVGGNLVNPPSGASLQTYRKTAGKLGGEDLFSAKRGYPACGTFYQDRLGLGGFAAKSSAFALSRTGEYFDLNILLRSVPSGALLINLDTDGPETIIAMAQSKHLVLFTTEADYFVSDRAISASAAPAIVQSSTNGASQRVPIVKQESGLVYVSREETIVYGATYDAVNEAYVSTPLSLLCSHLINNIRDAALQRAYGATDSERYWLVRDDGVMVPGLLIRNQEVTAFVRWQTDGQVRAVGVDGNNLVYLLVDRVIGGATVLCVETLEDGLWLDCAVTKTLAAPSAVVTGLGIFEGATVYAIGDGYVEGPFTVVGGQITMQYASSVVTVGRWTAPLVETLPLVRDVAAHTVLKRPARVFQLALDLMETTSLAVGANGRPPRDVALVSGPVPTDAPPPRFSGQRTIAGLAGWSPDGRVTITQKRPGALQLRGITVEAKI